jgi:hypothetical protein
VAYYEKMGGNDNSTRNNNLPRPEALLHAVPRVSCDQHSVEKVTSAAVFGDSALKQRSNFGGSQVELRVLCALELKWILRYETLAWWPNDRMSAYSRTILLMFRALGE